MFFVRFVLLAFLTAYSFSMGQIPSGGLNGFGKLVASLFFVVAPALYLLPTYEAWKNKHPNLTAIGLVNIFLGWSLVGWVFAVVWAYKKPESVVIASGSPVPFSPPPVSQPSAASARDTRKCPFCAEQVLIEAIKCKHCGSDLRLPPNASEGPFSAV